MTSWVTLQEHMRFLQLLVDKYKSHPNSYDLLIIEKLDNILYNDLVAYRITDLRVEVKDIVEGV